MVSTAFISGIGAGLCLGPSNVITGTHFEKRRALANGITFSASSIGAFCFPPLMKYWLDSYGLQGTLLITGGLMFHLSAAGMLFRPPEFFEIKNKSSGQVTPSSDSIPVPAEVSQSENYNVEIAGSEMSTSDTAACKDTEVYVISVSDVDSRKDVTSRPESMRSYEAWSQWNILKHPLLYIYALTMPVSDSSFVNSTIMIYPYATDIGISKFDAVFLISIMGICSGASRFLSGLFSDFNFIKKKYIYQAATLANGIVICLCPIVKQYVYLAIMSGLCGLFSGAAVVLAPVLVAEELGTANIPVTFSVLYRFVCYLRSGFCIIIIINIYIYIYIERERERER